MTLEQYRPGVFAVTGGADGIGYALAEQAVAAGLRAAIIDVREDAAEEAAARLRADGGEAHAYGCDVSDVASLEKTAARMDSADDVPTILWIHAGVGTLGGFLGATANDIEWVFEVNVMGAIRTARTFLPRMLAAGGPRHVGLTGSSQSIMAADNVYGASKHAALAIGEALRTELAGHGIGVTLLIPGLTNTRIWNGARARQGRFGGPVELPAEFGQPWRERGMPAETVAAAAFEAMANGGGYAILLPDATRIAQFNARTDDIRAALRVIDQTPETPGGR